jgi:hypothetical protein
MEEYFDNKNFCNIVYILVGGETQGKTVVNIIKMARWKGQA